MSQVPQWVSTARFEEYLVAANHDVDAASQLYEWNAAVSASFFEMFSYVEVALRNAIDGVLVHLEVPESARIHVHQGWWFASPTFLDNESLKFYEAARRHTDRGGQIQSRDKVLASMTFGVWASILGPSYENLFRKHLVHAFPNRPRGFVRGTAQNSVLALRNLRNRIAHHQAIFDHPLEERFEQAMDILGWINPDLQSWVRGISRVPELLNDRPPAGESMAVVVPARDAWTFYLNHGVYICQPGRFFQNISHLGFYTEKAIQREIPKVLKRVDAVPWTADEIGRLMGNHMEHDAQLAQIIKSARDAGWTGETQQIFFLTRPDEKGRTQGHVTLGRELASSRSGRGSAWVQRQRYVPVADLQSARTLSELDQQ